MSLLSIREVLHHHNTATAECKQTCAVRVCRNNTEILNRYVPSNIMKTEFVYPIYVSGLGMKQ